MSRHRTVKAQQLNQNNDPEPFQDRCQEIQAIAIIATAVAAVWSELMVLRLSTSGTGQDIRSSEQVAGVVVLSTGARFSRWGARWWTFGLIGNVVFRHYTRCSSVRPPRDVSSPPSRRTGSTWVSRRTPGCFLIGLENKPHWTGNGRFSTKCCPQKNGKGRFTIGLFKIGKRSIF